MPRGPLIVLSGPSGSGKSTVVRRLLERFGDRLHLAVSATTRPPRPGEVDGRDYHFLSREAFEAGLRDGQFLEHAELFGNYYGTPRSEVEAYRDKGTGVLLEIDVQGAEQIRRCCPEAVTIFLKAPSMEEYRRRLEQRRTESPEQIEARVRRALAEEAAASTYHYIVINDDLDRAVNEVATIVDQLFTRSDHAG